MNTKLNKAVKKTMTLLGVAALGGVLMTNTLSAADFSHSNILISQTKPEYKTENRCHGHNVVIDSAVETRESDVMRHLNMAFYVLSKTHIGEHITEEIPYNLDIRVIPSERGVFNDLLSRSTYNPRTNMFAISLSEDLFKNDNQEYIPFLLIKELQAVQMYKLTRQQQGYPSYDSQTVRNFEYLSDAVAQAKVCEAIRELQNIYPREFDRDYSPIGVSQRELMWYKQDHDMLFRQEYDWRYCGSRQANRKAVLRNMSSKITSELNASPFKPFDDGFYWEHNFGAVSRVIDTLIEPYAPYLKRTDFGRGLKDRDFDPRRDSVILDNNKDLGYILDYSKQR